MGNVTRRRVRGPRPPSADAEGGHGPAVAPATRDHTALAATRTIVLSSSRRSRAFWCGLFSCDISVSVRNGGTRKGWQSGISRRRSVRSTTEALIWRVSTLSDGPNRRAKIQDRQGLWGWSGAQHVKQGIGHPRECRRPEGGGSGEGAC